MVVGGTSRPAGETVLSYSGQRDGAAPGAGAADVHLRAGALQGAQGAEGGEGQGGPRPRQGDGGAQGQDSADGENSQVSHGYLHTMSTQISTIYTQGLQDIDITCANESAF